MLKVDRRWTGRGNQDLKDDTILSHCLVGLIYYMSLTGHQRSQKSRVPTGIDEANIHRARKENPMTYQWQWGKTPAEVGVWATDSPNTS